MQGETLVKTLDNALEKGFEGDTIIGGLAEHFRNLLFGILALQMDFVSRDAIRTGVEADAKEDVIRAMASSLMEAGKIQADQFEGIVEAILNAA